MKQDIKNLCIKYNISNYHIRDNVSIDTDSDVNLIGKLEDLKQLPLNFNEVSGYFNCKANNLTTLNGCPKEISGYFSCSENKLTSLEYSPIIIKVYFNCGYNDYLTSLDGLENTYIGGKLYVGGCHNLYSLSGFPKTIGGFDCWNTPIETIYDTFIQEPDTDAISRFNRLKVIGTDGLDWYVYYDQLGKFLRSVDKEHLIMSEKEFDDFMKTTKYRWDY
jgi:hypothetical protein